MTTVNDKDPPPTEREPALTRASGTRERPAPEAAYAMSDRHHALASALSLVMRIAESGPLTPRVREALPDLAQVRDWAREDGEMFCSAARQLVDAALVQATA